MKEPLKTESWVSYLTIDMGLLPMVLGDQGVADVRLAVDDRLLHGLEDAISLRLGIAKQNHANFRIFVPLERLGDRDGDVGHGRDVPRVFLIILADFFDHLENSFSLHFRYSADGL